MCCPHVITQQHSKSSSFLTEKWTPGKAVNCYFTQGLTLIDPMRYLNTFGTLHLTCVGPSKGDWMPLLHDQPEGDDRPKVNVF